MRTRFYSLARYTLVLCVGVAGGWLLHDSLNTTSAATPIREPQGKYRLIDPLIGFRVGDKSEFKEYKNLESKLTDEIALLTKKKKIHSVSVYFRDMQSGQWTGVNEEELYSPASLYKVALMMAVLKKAEGEPSLLDERIIFAKSLSAEKPDYTPMEIGRSYSVRELLTRLITLSDNDAKDLLRDRVGFESVSAVFTDLRLAEPALQEIGDSMSAQTYSRFFRALYNATYLSRADSEYALDLLSRVEFRSGIVNGLPSEARLFAIAHKFGYRVLPDALDGVTKELHDCGIVYAPEHPYFICIMTKGWENTDLYETIQALSSTAYTEVSAASIKP
ncbi:MAG: serine hydrolase [bacterium]|nr:serine hydrolase [bacterium]